MSQEKGLSVSDTTVLQLLFVEMPQLWQRKGRRGECIQKGPRALKGHCCPTDPVPLAEAERAVG